MDPNKKISTWNCFWNCTSGPIIYFFSFAVRKLRTTDLSHRSLCPFAAVRHGRTASSSTVSPSGDVLQKSGSAQLLRLLPRSSKGVPGVLQYAWRATEHQGHGSMYPLQNYGRTTFNYVKCNTLFEHMCVGRNSRFGYFLSQEGAAARIGLGEINGRRCVSLV